MLWVILTMPPDIESHRDVGDMLLVALPNPVLTRLPLTGRIEPLRESSVVFAVLETGR